MCHIVLTSDGVKPVSLCDERYRPTVIKGLIGALITKEILSDLLLIYEYSPKAFVGSPYLYQRGTQATPARQRQFPLTNQ